MKRGTILLVAFLLLVGACKKPHYQSCETCSCFSIDSLVYTNSLIDSVTFYRSILGTWYLQQTDSFAGPYPGSCFVQCYCDTQYSIVFLPNDSVIINFPFNARNTFSYFFFSDGNSMISPQGGYYTVPGHNGGLCAIGYSNKYLAISPANPYGFGTVSYSPRYFLARR